MLLFLQVKTQRALNDYRKSAFPHYKDEITRLRFIGVVSANRLKDARAHLGQDVPVECVDTVQDLKKLLEYAETNRCGTQTHARTGADTAFCLISPCHGVPVTRVHVCSVGSLRRSRLP